MCDLCGDPKHTDLAITIRDIRNSTAEKIEKTIEVLCKAAGIDFDGQNRRRQQAEVSPYKSVRELEADILSTVEERLNEMARMIIRKWLHVEKAASGTPFKINGRIYINPKTGKPMKRAEWKEIVATLESGFAWVFGDDVQDKMTAVATALGMILQTMADRQAAQTALLSELDVERLKDMASMEILQDTLAFAQQHTAEYIVDLQSTARRKISTAIITATRDRLTKDELESELFREFGDLNRDWRRIAETEIATNFNNGYLRSELSNAGKDETVFMVGITAANACPWCVERVMDHTVVLLDAPPADGDIVIVNGTPYEAIWPGKTNAGRARADWWVAAGSQHPHCRCTWTRTFEDEEFKEMEREFWAAAGGQ